MIARKRVRVALLWFTVTILFLLSTVLFLFAKKPSKITGTYTSLIYHEESGDVLGNEVRIVVGREGYEGTFQTSQGEPDRLVLIQNITVHENAIKFIIPQGSIHEGEFCGSISETGMQGILTLRNGNKIPLELKRGKSYWD